LRFRGGFPLRVACVRRQHAAIRVLGGFHPSDALPCRVRRPSSAARIAGGGPKRMSSTAMEGFLQLLEASRLLDERRMLKTRSRAARQPDRAAIAAGLVERGHLTRWQSRMLLAGKNGPFFLRQYRLLKQLGRGGMGAVFKAFQPGVNRIVAVKVLSGHALNDERANIRFRREIRAAAALDHPHIIRAYDADCVENRYFLVMEYVGGRDMKRWIQTVGRSPVGWSCECIRQAALGLQYAHERGIVHRDIKPSNLLLARRKAGEPPHVRIADFGLARAGLEITDEAGLTRIGQGLGTSEYVAPEQALDSSTADIRADIFSLGCTMFELLTGELPFPGKNALERVTARLQNEAPKISSLRADVPANLDRIASRMMARDPEQRFQTPAEVAEALAPFCRPDEATPASDKVAVDARSHLSALESASDSDPAVNQFLESLSGELSSRSLPSMSLPKKPDALHARLSLWIAAAAVIVLLAIVSWTLVGTG
jgi:serine/threonine protein kinase